MFIFYYLDNGQKNCQLICCVTDHVLDIVFVGFSSPSLYQVSQYTTADSREGWRKKKSEQWHVQGYLWFHENSFDWNVQVTPNNAESNLESNT